MGVAKQINEMMAEYPWAARIPPEGKDAVEVIDLSTSAPSVKPPESVRRAFLNAMQNEKSGAHRYMTNAGYIETRRAVSRHLAESTGIEVPPELIVMCYGASGGINITLKALLNPEEEVIIVSPHPFEDPIFVWNHGGIPIVVGSNADFSLNVGRLAAAADLHTKALLIGCPNDPTGAVYTDDSIRELAGLLEARQKEFNNTIYIIWDSRYSRIMYDGAPVTNIFSHYENSILVGSFSKDLVIGGDRGGYVAVNPRCPYKEKVFAAIAMVIRTLGFVNCPALMQNAIAHMDFGNSELPSYTKARDLVCGALREFGYEFQEPQGGYFVFVKSPTGDDDFVENLKEKGVLVAPGAAFGAPGYFRVSFCVEEDNLREALRAFEKLSPAGNA